MEGWQSKNASGARVRNRGEGACADLMTGDQGNSFTQQNGKGIPQFAPNFTVYVLPPDVVCLYSEDRKFLLHGELYCGSLNVNYPIWPDPRCAPGAAMEARRRAVTRSLSRPLW